MNFPETFQPDVPRTVFRKPLAGFCCVEVFLGCSLPLSALSLLALAPLSAFGFPDWQQPTSDGLTMTSEPAPANVPAVYLFREATVNNDFHMHSMYARIKILNEKGKEMFSDIEIPYEATNFGITDFAGRTIHT
jgi:hypothetical protein